MNLWEFSPSCCSFSFSSSGLIVASALIDVSQQKASDFKEKSLAIKNRKALPPAHQGTCVWVATTLSAGSRFTPSDIILFQHVADPSWKPLQRHGMTTCTRFHLAATTEVSTFQEHNLCYPFFALFALSCIRQPQKSFSWILDSPFSFGSQWRALSRHLTAQWLLQSMTDKWMRRLWNSWSFRLKDFGRPQICSAWRKKQRCLYVRLYQSKQISLTPLWKCNKWLEMAG